MHVARLTIENIRSVERLDIQLPSNELAGWHVVLGDNGAGKSTVVRALALAFMGNRNAEATRQDWSHWIGAAGGTGAVNVRIKPHPHDELTGLGRPPERDPEVRLRIATEHADDGRNGNTSLSFSGRFATRTIWGGGSGWFSASFGPFRRFSGGDPTMDRLYHSHPRLAPHLSAFGEAVALNESLRWLRDLHFRALEADEQAAAIKDAVISFVNNSELLPHGTRIKDVTSERVAVVDGRNSQLAVEEMSDGYRSILSLTFELLRLMFSVFGTNAALAGVDMQQGIVNLPGVVVIDEVDAHLHPSWQQRIGSWFVRSFPAVQFFVTTHSPIICRAAEHGSVWLLPPPDTDGEPRRVAGNDLNRLLYGNVLDAFGTDIFGRNVTRSEQSTSGRPDRRTTRPVLGSSRSANLVAQGERRMPQTW